MKFFADLGFPGCISKGNINAEGRIQPFLQGQTSLTWNSMVKVDMSIPSGTATCRRQCIPFCQNKTYTGSILTRFLQSLLLGT